MSLRTCARVLAVARRTYRQGSQPYAQRSSAAFLHTTAGLARDCHHSTTVGSTATQTTVLPSSGSGNFPSQHPDHRTLAHAVGHRTSSSSALFRTTRTNLFLPPQLARALGAAGLILAQTFYIAYRRESQKLDEEERENERDSGQRGARADKPFMTPVEAIQLLGVEKANPSLLASARHISDGSESASNVLPLRNPRDIEVAKENFNRMFGLAMKHDNLFIAGKLSNAYRMCVDPMWDQTTEADADAASGEETSTSQIGTNGDKSNAQKQ